MFLFGLDLKKTRDYWVNYGSSTTFVGFRPKGWVAHLCERIIESNKFKHLSDNYGAGDLIISFGGHKLKQSSALEDLSGDSEDNPIIITTTTPPGAYIDYLMKFNARLQD